MSEVDEIITTVVALASWDEVVAGSVPRVDGTLGAAAAAFAALNQQQRMVCWALNSASGCDQDAIDGAVRFLRSSRPLRSWRSTIVARTYKQAREIMGAVLGIDGVERSTLALRETAREFSGKSGIYVIRCESSGRFKIGRSVDLSSRLLDHARSLATSWMPGPLRCVRVIECPTHLIVPAEQMAHWIFGRWRIGESEIFEAGLDPDPASIKTIDDLAMAFIACFDAARGIRR